MKDDYRGAGSCKNDSLEGGYSERVVEIYWSHEFGDFWKYCAIHWCKEEASCVGDDREIPWLYVASRSAWETIEVLTYRHLET